MRSLYDNVGFGTSIEPQTQTGTGTITGNSVDSLGYNSAALRVRVGAATGAPTSVAISVRLQESDTSGSGGFADALDRSGAIIAATANQTSPAAASEGLARIEGLGNVPRKRYLRLIASATFTGGTAVILMGEIVMGRAYQNPVNSAVSNT